MELIHIDLHRILRSRITGIKGKLIPGFLISALERLIRQDDLNAALEATYPKEGVEFADALFEYFDIGLEVDGLDKIKGIERPVFASNHPLGGLDGIGLIKVLGRIYGDSGLKVLVNDMLMNVEPLRRVFLPVNKFGGQGREAPRLIREAFDGEEAIVMFPAGLVSRKGDDGRIADLRWQKTVVSRAIESKRPVVPVLFIGENRPRFYNTARWRKKLRLKVNVEQALLPGELCASRGKRFRVVIGDPVPWETLKGDARTPAELAALLREKVYALSPERGALKK